MTTRANSAARRDIAYHLHPYTNAKKHEAEGPLVITRGKGVYVYDDEGQGIHRGDGRPVVRRRSASARSGWSRRRRSRCASCPSTTPSRTRRPSR